MIIRTTMAMFAIAGLTKAQKEATGDASIMGGGELNIELKKEAARRFDAAAKRIYNQNPKGLIATILDGQII